MSNFLKRFFTQKKEINPTKSNNFQQFTNGGGNFTTWSGNAYENDIYRSGVDAIAKHFAKIKLTHYIEEEKGDTNLNYLLQTRPNPFISTYDFLYKIITHLYLFNNAYVYISKDQQGNITGFYPINYTSAQFGTGTNDDLVIHFTLTDGTQVYLSYGDIIHLRKNFNSDDFVGDANTAIDDVLEVSHYQNEGIVSGIKMGSNIRGIVKYTNLISDEKLKENHQKFMDSYLNMSNSGGVVTLDEKTEYTPIENKNNPINKDDLEPIKKRIYNYLNISEKIVNSTFDEDEFTAFYESVIEPIALQLALEMTAKMFTEIELQNKNTIHFESSRLNYSNNATKIKLVSELLPSGLLTINQALQVLGFPKVDDETGNKRLQTLNYINAELADNYQLNEKEAKLKDEAEEHSYN